MTMARTRSIDRLRSRAGRNRREESLTDYCGAAAAQPSGEPEQREAIELAEMLGQPLGTVKTRIRLGMMKLRSLLGGRVTRWHIRPPTKRYAD